MFVAISGSGLIAYHICIEVEQSQNLNKEDLVGDRLRPGALSARSATPVLTMLISHQFLAHARCQHHYPSLTAVERVVCSQR